jgi:predicted DNA-binding transcriptional regulator AlpA
MRMYDTRQAAEFLGLKPVTLEAWRCRGGGPRFVKLGHAVRYRSEDLDAYIEANIHANTSAACEGVIQQSSTSTHIASGS